MRRGWLNFIIDLASFVNLACLGFTGFIMKFILPPGTGGRGRQFHRGLGAEHIKEFWSLTRHEWGGIHFYLAGLFIILMAIHIVLHWGWIKNYFKSFFSFSLWS